ncbi:MAG: toprim domain-containing protein, partial [Fimbriimonadaceae bacterium]|nr:toprim domain-containing protein [Fimbriimonadaceae bacterium]
DGVLGLCEGIETGLAVMTACHGLPVWAALSTSGLEQALLVPEARRVVILADHDHSGAGLRAAEAAATKLRLEGREVCIALPPVAGDDFNDMLRRDGAAAIAALVDAAMRQPAASAAPPQPETGRHLPIGFVEPSHPLPSARSDEGNLDRATARAWGLILGANRSPWLYRLGGEPSWVVPDDEGRPIAMPVRDERLRHMLAKLADWRKLNAKGDLVPAPPPTGMVKSLVATPDPALPILAGIVTAPMFGRGGALLTEPGYHSDARLLYQPPPGFVLPPVPERPSQAEIDAARALLCDDLLGDFPFTGEAERAHVLALLLLGFVRPMVDGPTPLHMIEKPTPGTGATLMVDAIATILTGCGASVMTEGRDEDEWRKRLTAKLRQLPALLLIDNLRQELDSAALAAALTAPAWEDRILGQSEMVRLPIRCAWVATGNNPAVSHEIARRLVRIRLDSRSDQPWRRDGFRHPDLMVWIRSNRARLVAACLTLCRAWIAAGRPRGARSLGSFEGWCHTLGGILEVAGVSGFLGNLDEVLEASDTEGNTWRSLIQLWWDRFGSAEVSVSDLTGFAQTAEASLPITAKTDHALKVSLGVAFRKLRDRAFRTSERLVHLRSCGIVHNSQRWRLEPAPEIVSEGGLGGVRGDSATESPIPQTRGMAQVGGSGGSGGTFSVLSPPTHARAHA